MNKPFCIECCQFMRPEKNGVVVEEMMPDNRPYKLWSGDMWKCPQCGKRIVSGFGFGPITEHFQDNYKSRREAEDNRGNLYSEFNPKEKKI